MYKYNKITKIMRNYKICRQTVRTRFSIESPPADKPARVCPLLGACTVGRSAGDKTMKRT